MEIIFLFLKLCRNDNIKTVTEIRGNNVLSFVQKSLLNVHIGVHVTYVTLNCLPVKKKKKKKIIIPY